MALTDFEIKQLTRMVADRMGKSVSDADLSTVVAQVTESLQAKPNNPEITGATCEVSPPRQSSQPSHMATVHDVQTPPTATPTHAVNSEQLGLYQQIEQTDASRVIVAAFGQNRPGIVAAVTRALSETACNIEDMSQTIMQDVFTLIMLVDISGANTDFPTVRDRLTAIESELGMKVFVMHEDIFRYMHRI